MVKECFSVVRAGGANSRKGFAWNAAVEVGETDGFPQSLRGYYCILTGIPLCLIEASSKTIYIVGTVRHYVNSYQSDFQKYHR